MAFLRKQFGEYSFMLLVLLIGISATLGLSWEYQRDQTSKQVMEFKAAAEDRIGLNSG